MRVAKLSMFGMLWISILAAPALACGPGGGSGLARSGGFKSGLASNRGFVPNLGIVSFQPNGFARQNFAAQAAARRARLRPMRIARTVQQRQDMLAKREQRRELLARRAAERRQQETLLAESRTWTDNTGKFQTEAKFLEVNDGQARLQKTNGQIVSVPLSRLSLADQNWLRVTQPLPATNGLRAGSELLAVNAR